MSCESHLSKHLLEVSLELLSDCSLLSLIESHETKSLALLLLTHHGGLKLRGHRFGTLWLRHIEALDDVGEHLLLMSGVLATELQEVRLRR